MQSLSRSLTSTPLGQWFNIPTIRINLGADLLYEHRCGPCKMIGPIIEEMATQFPQVKVGKLDVDSNPDTSVEYGIRSIPTVLFLKDGQIVERHVGTGSKTFFFEKVESLLK